MQLSNEQHAEILGAFIARLPLLDLERIIQASRKSWHATHNEGAKAQAAAQAVEQGMVLQAITRMADYDKDRIATIAATVLTEAATC